MTREPVRIWEWLGLGILTLVALLLRGYGISDQGLSHFDAGVYATSGLWPWTGRFHFAQGYFSPPLYPTLVGVANLLLGGPADWAGAGVSVVAGTAIIPLGWRLARNWFGPAAGLFAAALLTFSGMQIVFARTGITDSTFCALFLASLITCESAIADGGWRRILLAGVVVGLCWNTKYNGFLPLVLSVPLLLHSSWSSRISRYLQISLIALACYAPWALSFHVKHGYGSLVEHQRGYVLGLASAWETGQEVFSDLNIVATPMLGLTLAVGALVGTILGARWIWLLALLAPVVALQAYSAYLIGDRPWLIGACIGAVLGGSLGSRGHRTWLLGWLLVLPTIYTPYMRLWLPTHAIVMILSAGTLSRLLLPKISRWPSLRSSTFLWLRVAVCAIVVWVSLDLIAGKLNRSSPRDFWREHVYPATPGYREAAAEIVEDVPAEAPIYTLCRWPMNYYLSLAGRDVRPISGSDLPANWSPPEGVLLVDRALEDTPSFARTYNRLRQSRGVSHEYGIEPDIVTLLDDFSGSEVWQLPWAEVKATYDVRLIPLGRTQLPIRDANEESDQSEE